MQRSSMLSLSLIACLSFGVACTADPPEPNGDDCEKACLEGQVQCLNASQYRRCERSQGCLRWSAASDCGERQRCQASQCVDAGTPQTCSDLCQYGETQCSDKAHVQRCQIGAEHCLLWGEPEACGEDRLCEGKRCVPKKKICQDLCQEGESRCKDQTEPEHCERGSSGCTLWQSAGRCAAQEHCEQGRCLREVEECEDRCVKDSQICEGKAFKRCGDWKQDGCLDWSEPQACEHGCANGQCKKKSEHWAPACQTKPCPFVIEGFPYQRKGNTKSGKNNFSNYGCMNISEAGPEEYYVLRLEEAGTLLAGLTEKTPVDVDIHLLNALEAQACIVRSDKAISRHLKPGIYYLSIDSYQSQSYAGAYEVFVHFIPDSSPCAMKATTMERINTPKILQMPITGPVVKEAHLVTTVDKAKHGGSTWWPSSASEGLAQHKARSAAITGLNYPLSENWAPAGEGGSRYGQGSVAAGGLPEEAEAWYVCMYWTRKSRPAPGTRYLVFNPINGKAVVAAAGYETGPGDGSQIGGAVEEIHHYCGSSHKGYLSFGEMLRQDLDYGPIHCP